MVKRVSDFAPQIAAECLATRARLVNRALTSVYEEALRPYGVTTSQMNILIVIAAIGSPLAADITDALQIDKSTLSRGLERMRGRGWIQTRPAPDPRGKLLGLTDEGERVLRECRPAWKSAQRQVRDMLGKKDAKALDRMARSLGLVSPKT